MRRTLVLLLLSLWMLPVVAEEGAEEAASAVYDTAFLSVTLLEEQLGASPHRRIPIDLRVRARCVGVFPSVVKGGFIIAASSGNGLLACRREDGRFGPPAVFNMNAASIGIQAGIQTASYVLLFLHEQAVEALLAEEVSFGTDISLAAGPVGGTATVGLLPDVVSYVSTSGLFAGVDLGGASLSADREANAELYGSELGARAILLESETVPQPLAPFHETVGRFAPTL